MRVTGHAGARFTSKGEGGGMELKGNARVVRGDDNGTASVSSALTYADSKCSQSCCTVCQNGFIGLEFLSSAQLRF